MKYAVFGGFGNQCWTSPGRPDIYGKCDGLTVCSVDPDTGEMALVSQSHGVESPSTLVVSPDQCFIYAANDSHDFNFSGICAFLPQFSRRGRLGRC